MDLKLTSPLDIVIKDDPVSVASYADENNLIDTIGWKRVKHIAKNQKKLQRMVDPHIYAIMLDGVSKQ